ncbi:hypothetical protein E2C01_066915 [Portunus trituberculatus]|uniref:Uncharacterized protein n=1 Tax=Portunus trituberculatus TaxID=210409 RepID=A0A5B7HRA6_PORTR|nr:hypothetical protein [Portunus trituberculatus]
MHRVVLVYTSACWGLVADLTEAGFDEVDDNDVQNLLESHAEPLSNDELMELDKAEKEGDEEEEPVRGLDIKTQRECLGGIEKLWKP